jgi:CBS domain-containing protein
VPLGATLADAAAVMRARGTELVLVLDGPRVAGLLTAADLRQAGAERVSSAAR